METPVSRTPQLNSTLYKTLFSNIYIDSKLNVMFIPIQNDITSEAQKKIIQ